jgi:hypothetical protein
MILKRDQTKISRNQSLTENSLSKTRLQIGERREEKTWMMWVQIAAKRAKFKKSSNLRLKKILLLMSDIN